MESTISSTEFYEGEEITLTATPDSGAALNLFHWIINFTTDDLQYSIQELQRQGKSFKAISSSGTDTATSTATVTQQADSINTLTPLLLQVSTSQYIASALNTALNSNNFFVDTGTTYNITWTNSPFKKITGIVTWLRQWFYTKDDIDSKDTGWTDLTYESGYENYGSVYSNLKIRRIDKFVEIRGVFKPTAQKSASTEAVQFATVPSGYRPSTQLRVAICQGSGLNRWALTVTTDGKIGWSRYGTTSSANVSSGAWMNVHITYMIDG